MSTINAEQEYGSVRAPGRGDLQQSPQTLNRSGFSSAGLPFGEIDLRPNSKQIASMPTYDGLSFEPFARAFQHVDHVTQSDTRNAGRESADEGEVQPFARHLARPPYSHHDEDSELAIIQYDEDSQTTLFPPGIVAWGKGWCRRGTFVRWRFGWKTDTVRD